MSEATRPKRNAPKVHVGDTFARLTVVENDLRMPPSPRQAKRGHSGDRAVRVVCECGKTLVVRRGNLLSGNTRSCGCFRDEFAPERGRKQMESNWRDAGFRQTRSAQLSAERSARWTDPEYAAKYAQAMTTHGLARHQLYQTHHKMMRRCYRASDPAFRNYGGRGISVYRPWHDVAVFIGWIEGNLGPRPSGMTLDRIDNDSCYEPGNVRWATAYEQRHNQRGAEG